MRPGTARRLGTAGLLMTVLAACGPVIHGLGDGAYWDVGRDTVVVLVGRNVFEVVDDVPANIDIYPDVAGARLQAATALAGKILSHR